MCDVYVFKQDLAVGLEEADQEMQPNPEIGYLVGELGWREKDKNGEFNKDTCAYADRVVIEYYEDKLVFCLKNFF